MTTHDKERDDASSSFVDKVNKEAVIRTRHLKRNTSPAMSNTDRFAEYIILAVGFSYVYWKLWLRPRLESKKPFDNIPMPPDCHWLFGHVRFLKQDFETNLKHRYAEFADKHGRTGLWIFSQRALGVTSWDDARTVLHSEYIRTMPKMMARFLNNVLGPKSIGKLKGREWKFHRSAVLKSFSPSSLADANDAMVTVIDTVCVSLSRKILSSIEKKILMDVEPLMKMITVDIAGLAVFSRPFQCCEKLQPSELASAFDFLGYDMVRRMGQPFRPANYFYCLPTMPNRQYHASSKVLRSFITKAVEERQLSIACDGKAGKIDLLTNLLLAHDAAKEELQYEKRLSKDTLSDIMMSILFASFDTTSITLSYALYCVSQYPEIEANLLEEIHKSDVTKAGQLVYTKAVLYETLRMYPSAPATARTLQKSIKLSDGFVVPKGTQVMIPIWTIHRKEENFSRPEEFLPERWVRRKQHPIGGTVWVEREKESGSPASSSATALEESDGDDIKIPAGNHEAFFAFSGGGRSCPGKKFALQEATLILAGLLGRFRFEALNEYVLQPERNGMVQHPKGGIPMMISLR